MVMNSQNNYGGPIIPATPPQPVQRDILTIDVISGEQQAYSFYVAPGVTAVLFDFSASVFYIKATDSRGIPQPMRVCDFKERITQPQNQQQDSNALQAQIDELKNIVLSMAQQNQPTQPQNSQRNQKKGGNN